MACRRCNSEKRRDDQVPDLVLAPTGWKSFLSHDGSRCQPNCKSCAYWFSLWPDSTVRGTKLLEVTERIEEFRRTYGRFVQWTEANRLAVQSRVESLYRSCQHFATSEIAKLTSDLNFDFEALRVS